MRSYGREGHTKKSNSAGFGDSAGIFDCDGNELYVGDYVYLLATQSCGTREGRIYKVTRTHAIVALPRYESHYLPLDGGERMLVKKMTDAEVKSSHLDDWYAYTWGELEKRQRPHHK